MSLYRLTFRFRGGSAPFIIFARVSRAGQETVPVVHRIGGNYQISSGRLATYPKEESYTPIVRRAHLILPCDGGVPKTCPVS
jgi:hypothetical protein